MSSEKAPSRIDRMSLSTAIQNPETVHHASQHVAASLANLSTENDVNMKVEEDEEEEDVDFNPFLREEASSEASSSLSSENDGPGDNVEKNLWSSVDCQDACASSRPTDEAPGYVRDSGNEEVTVMQTSLEEANVRESVPGNSTKTELTSSIQQDRSLVCPVGGNFMPSFGDGSDAANDLREEELREKIKGSSNPRNFGKPIIQLDNEEAICRRTRARHSLVNYTLEELETFLQESDDDDFQNVDDEEEYRKFLAAVLLEGVANGQTEHEDENVDEDEENDADFVIEIEEALESDVDESLDNNEGRNDKQEGVAHRPETRQKKCLKESVRNKKYHLGQAKIPLRPILPNGSNAQVAPFPSLGFESSPKRVSYWPSSLSGTDLINGFTVHQIGQLYCLVYEHVQLLIQAFSVSVLDPGRQQVATEVQKMISEMVKKREEALACRKVPYPVHCFNPQNLHSSLHYDFYQTAKCSFWTPVIYNPVLSVLDVAPLELAKRYTSDVSATVLRYRRSHLEDVGDKIHLEREPLFPLPMVASFGETDSDALGGMTTMSSNTIQSLSPAPLQPKKSLAATLVESTKKESVALVPKDIAKLAQRFYPLFYSALFPHKPPIPPVANRVLFTDSEDGLLAMGLMEYNNDWTAIQRRFLPCKSQNQIFVRQKNRSSSKAPENPIKAVRRMKTSPLTADEMARITEGFKVFKHDWMSIWNFFVPHRDPSLLPRQWRIATGTHKSYKKDEAFKEKRRLYEAKRRKGKALTDWQTSSEKEVGHGENMADDMDDEDEAYVHEAFLADTEPSCSKHITYDISPSSISRSNVQSANFMPYRSTHISRKCAAVPGECGESQQETCAMHATVTSSKPLGDMHPLPHISNVRCNAFLTASFGQLSSNSITLPSRSHLGSWPCHVRRRKGVRVVKLAPDLPPVNLPSSVRVISQSDFKRYDSGPSYSKTDDDAVINHLHWLPQVSKDGTATAKPRNHANSFSANGPQINSRQDESTLADQYVAEENTSETDLHMHPLLFEASEQFSSYYPMNCTASGTYNFFPETPLQEESNLHKSQNLITTHINTIPHSEAAPLNLRTIDFHPLLQRIDVVSVDSAVMSSVDQPSGDLKSLQGNHDKFPNPSDCTLREPLVGESQLATGTSSSSQCEKESNLDLDIRLYSGSDREKATKGIDMSKDGSVEEGVPTLEPKMVEKGPHGDKLFLNHRDKHPEVSVTTNTYVRSWTCSEKNVCSLEVVPLRNRHPCQCPEDSHDESVPEIVMEQEELSDSDEEIQHVEFECEEMDDSEGEGLDSELPTEIQTKGELQSRYSSTQVSVDEKGKSCASPRQGVSRGSCHAGISQLKPQPQHEGAKRGRSALSAPRSVLRHRTSKTRNTEGSKPQSVATQQLHARTVGERDESVASRKPRKRSILK